ncbi:MAG: hypothetical protein ACR2OZ_12435 [Verrucomicrobiales bacterium]
MKCKDTPEGSDAVNVDSLHQTAPHGEMPSATACTTSLHGRQFIAVGDSRNRRVPGLWKRGSRFYGALWSERPDGRKQARRFPLTLEDGRTPVETLTEAKEAMLRLKAERMTDRLPTGGTKPKFKDFAETYLSSEKYLLKKPGTQALERLTLDAWRAYLGDVRLDKITPATRRRIH